MPYLHYQADGAGASERLLQEKIGEVVSVLDYGAAGDGESDDSAAIQAAIDANQGGTILLPQGYIFFAAGILLSGSEYDGTAIRIEGTFLLKPYDDDNFQNTTYCGIAFHDVEYCSLDVPGMMDGNRAAQDANQQRHLVILAGVRNFMAAQFRCREIRGDGILVLRKTLAETGDVDSVGDSSDGIFIGPCFGYNSDDDGRNLISIICADNVTLAGGVSLNIGGVIDSERMPGGIDIECDQAVGHRVRHVRSGPWVIHSRGTSGIGIIGSSAASDDSLRDWTVEDIAFSPSTVINTGDPAGGPIIRRARGVTADISVVRTGDPAQGIDVDYADFVSLRCRASGVSSAVVVGFSNYVFDSNIHVEVEDHTAAGLLVTGAGRCRFTGHVRGAADVNAFGVQVAPGPRAGNVTASIAPAVISPPTPPTMTVSSVIVSPSIVPTSLAPGSVLSGSGVTGGTTIVKQLSGTPNGVGTYEVTPSQTVASTTIAAAMPTQIGVMYSVSVPYGPSYAFWVSAGMTFGSGCAVRDCSFDGYSDYIQQINTAVAIPARNIEGRHFATAVPSTGAWTKGEFVQNADPVPASGKVLLGWSRLTNGNAHSGGTDWTPAYATTS